MELYSPSMELCAPSMAQHAPGHYGSIQSPQPLCPQPVPPGPSDCAVSSSAAVSTTSPATRPAGRAPAPRAGLGPTVRLVSGRRAGGAPPGSLPPTKDYPCPPAPQGPPSSPTPLYRPPRQPTAPWGWCSAWWPWWHCWWPRWPWGCVTVTGRRGRRAGTWPWPTRRDRRTHPTTWCQVSAATRCGDAAPAPVAPLTRVPTDVPPSHTHYYSNPSYHTLSQCTLPAPGAPDRASSLKVRHSTARRGVSPCTAGLVLCGAAWCRVVWGCMMRHSAPRCCTVHHGVVQCTMVLYSAPWC